jgi:hypothetical protein
LRQDFQPVVDGFPALADLQQGGLNLGDVAVVLLLLFLDEGQRPLDVVDLAGDLGEGVLLDADEVGQAGFFGLAQGQDLFDAVMAGNSLRMSASSRAVASCSTRRSRSSSRSASMRRLSYCSIILTMSSLNCSSCVSTIGMRDNWLLTTPSCFSRS